HVADRAVRCRDRARLFLLRARRSRTHEDPILFPENRRRASGSGGTAAEAPPVTRRDGAPTARDAARSIWEASLAAADVDPLLRATVRWVDPSALAVGDARIDLGRGGRVLAVGCGKASGAMAVSLEEIVGERLSGGLVVVKDGYTAPTRRVR